jgi:hypothetical protein
MKMHNNRVRLIINPKRCEITRFFQSSKASGDIEADFKQVSSLVTPKKCDLCDTCKINAG